MLYQTDNSTKKRHQIDTGTDTNVDTKMLRGINVSKNWKQYKRKEHGLFIRKIRYINLTERKKKCQEKVYFLIYILPRFHYNVFIMK